MYLGDKMKFRLFILTLILLLRITVSTSIAQQTQNALITKSEFEVLQNRISELEKKLQTLENVEKMELAAKLAEAQAKHADAHAKLIETEFDKLKLELKDSNQQWLITCIVVFFAFLSAGGIALWSRLTKKMDDSITNEVEKRINRFQDAIDQVNILEPQVKILNKEHAASVIEQSIRFYYDEDYYQKIIDEITEEALLDLFTDNTRNIQVRSKAIKVLADRKSTKYISPVLEFLNSTLDSDTYKETGFDTQLELKRLVNYLGMIHKQEVYDGLTLFLDRLLLEDTEMKEVYITWTVFSLGDVGYALDIGSSISKMRDAIPYLEAGSGDKQALQNLARHFDKFNEPDGIKELLTEFGSMTSDIKETCLDLLEKYEPDFVREQREEKAANNTDGEEANESDPTE